MNTSRMMTGFALLAALAVCSWPTDGQAYSDWGGCVECHGEFAQGDYVSAVDGQAWGTDLMSGHEGLVDGDCDVCHGESLFDPVLLDSSLGGAGLDPISCLGCHGRAETEAGGAVTGAGLRQHHWNAGTEDCQSACHNDADPTGFTTVGEDVQPPYYADPDAPATLPTDPCNPEPYNEDILMAAPGPMNVGGLDNDGDGLYDTQDVIDCPEPGSVLLRCAALASFAVLARRRRRMT